LVNPNSTPVGSDGLDVCQAPNGNLIEARISSSAVYVHKPIEPPSSALTIKAVFPATGGLSGGYILDVYGINFPTTTATVTVRGVNCPVQSKTDILITCRVPAGTIGIADVVVSGGGLSDTFSKGFRYIKGSV
jgi:IPT/TIG domain